ncbi:MAG: ATP synthase subunit I [Candidatus Binataceae bacterium]
MIEIVVLRIVPYAVFGSMIGAAYFTALEWNVRLYAVDGAGWQALLIHLARIAFAIAAFTLCAIQGAAPLLASFVGFLAMRTITVHRHKLVIERNP